MSKIEQINFSFVIPRKLAGMSMPGRWRDPGDDITFLQSKGVTQIVNLSGKSYGTELFHQTFEILEFPIEDFSVPTSIDMDRLWEVYQALPLHSIMAVHCHMGIGRTGLVLACIYGRVHNLSGDKAIDRIRAYRESIETGGQEGFVDTYLNDRRIT